MISLGVVRKGTPVVFFTFLISDQGMLDLNGSDIHLECAR